MIALLQLHHLAIKSTKAPKDKVLTKEYGYIPLKSYLWTLKFEIHII